MCVGRACRAAGGASVVARRVRAPHAGRPLAACDLVRAAKAAVGEVEWSGVEWWWGVGLLSPAAQRRARQRGEGQEEVYKCISV